MKWHHFLIHRTSLQGDAHIGAGAVAQRLGINIEATACDDVAVDETLHTLMDSCTRDAALCSNVLERYAGILREDAEDFLVKIVDFVHLFSLTFTFC